MRLKKLELLGFKSFCDKTTIHFQSGITAFIGPNGCGKSNIADAILWVLGEQSTKTLRGERMEDVIFNGTETRKSIGMAEVNLILGEIATGQLSGDFGEYHELTLTRRLYRSGESDYLINKIPCRLKDIRDLLIDTGAGAKGHTVIEQGKVDEILNSSPARRREIIEETAGIAKYKIRRNEALRKLESTQQNLLRVRDIISEVKKQMNSLDRQAKKAERYQQICKEMKDLELAITVYEGRILENTAKQIKEEFEGYEIKNVGLETKLTQMEIEIEQRRFLMVEKENELNRMIQSINEKEGSIQKHEGKILILESQLAEWREQFHQALEEKSGYQSTFEEIENKKNDLKRDLERLNLLLDDKEKLLHGKEAEDQLLLEKVRRHQLDYDSENINFTQMITDAGKLTACLATQSSRMEEIQKRVEKDSFECAEVHQRYLNSKQLEEEELKKQSMLAETVRRQIDCQLKLEEESKVFQSELNQQGDELSSKRERLHTSRARLDSLNDLQKNRAGYWQGIKSLLAAKEKGEIAIDLPGCVADFIEVQPQFEKAIESVLNERLQGILVNSSAESYELIQYLKSKNLGKGLFILKEPGSNKRKIPLAEENSFEITEGVLGSAIDKIKCTPGFESVVESLLINVVIVKDLKAAFSLWERSSCPLIYVTLDGEVIDASGAIWGGTKEDGREGLLQRQREIKDLQNGTGQLTVEINQLEETQAQLKLKVQVLLQEKKTVEELLHQMEIEKATHAKLIEKLKQDNERFGERETQLKKEIEEGIELRGSIEKESEMLQKEILSIQESKTLAEGRIAELKLFLQEKLAEKDQLGGQLTEIKIEVMTLKGEAHHTLSNLRELENNQEEITRQIGIKEETILTLENKQKGAHQEKESILQQIFQISSELEQFNRQKNSLAEDHETLSASLRIKDEALRLIRKEIDEARKRKNESEVKWTEARIKMEHLEQFLQTHYQMSCKNAMALDFPEFEYEHGKIRFSELKSKLDQIGAVNMTAIDEYRELEERFNFLTAQEGDLTQSIQSLQEAIQKINKTTRILFNETFSALNRKFMDVFVSFFEGGKAEMVLLDEANPFESGVDIIVQPPGKKVRNVSMLSGGEKALTAIALLFASFLIHPSPFCILDEIDAPLDEENIRRFTQVLKKMTDHSQFIVITHNKRTMETADILYGVTQEEAGISKFISVHMNSVKTAAKPTVEFQPTASP